MSPDKHLANRTAFAATLKMMKEKTGKESFTMDEMSNPAKTIQKYKRT